MLKHIVELSLRHRFVVVMSALVLAVYGVLVTRQTKLDVFPEFAPPRIVIQTEAPGFSAAEVESLVTRPIEYGLNGTPNLAALYSQSIQGLSVVTVVFRDGTDILRARQLTSERLAELGGQLPEGAGTPAMGPLTSSTSLTLVLGLRSNERSPTDLRTFADWVVRLRLLGVSGVARIEVFGGEVRQFQVQVRPERLIAYGLSLEDVLGAAKRSAGVRGAGFIENENQRISIRTSGGVLTTEALGEAVVESREGSSLRLKDVAEVVEGPAPKLGDGLVMGEPGVVMMVHSQYGANTIEVTGALERALEELKPLLASEKIVLTPDLFRPASFIEAAIGNINRSLAIGGVFVILVLFLFLANLRSACIAFSTIPLSLLAAVIVLDALGVSLNTITLGGFAISVGVVVDDAIIGLENVWRRLRENRSQPGANSAFVVVRDATLEVRSPVVYATFIVAAVFWPVLMMSGVNGRLFAPLAVSFILATIASLVVAVTLTPALCLLMLSRAPGGEPGYIRWLKQGHRKCLEWLSRWPRLVLSAAAVLCIAAAALLPFFGGEFLPEFNEGHYILRLSLAPGSSVQASRKVGIAVSELLLKNPGVRLVSQEIGRAEQGEDTVGPEFSEFHVDLRPMRAEEQQKVKEQIRAALEKLPGFDFALTPFLQERIDETLSGGLGEVVFNLVGADLDALDRAAVQVKQTLQTIRGATDVFSVAGDGSPELSIHLRRDRLRQFGFEPLRVLEAVQTACQGTTVAQTYDNNRVVDVQVVLHPDSRRDPGQIGELPVQNAQGVRLPLRELAELESTSGRYLLEHEGTLRRRQVTCNVEGRDLASFMAQARNRLKAEVSLPPGISLRSAGAAEAQGKAHRELLIHSGVAAMAIVMLLSMVFGHARNLLLVLVNLPFALAGGVFAAMLGGGSLSVGSLVGFVSLFGISMRNSILLISHYEGLVTVEGRSWSWETAVQGATERLLPILMTALVVALALLPIALGARDAGKEIEGPMAQVILGGLVTSTLLNLLVLPIMALRFGRFRKREEVPA